MAAPALAAEVTDVDIQGQQFINEDCARNEYVVSGTYTGTTNDGSGFDDVRVVVWDDGVMKDSRDFEVAVGATVDVSTFLSFVGLYGSGAPGVGIQILDIDDAGSIVDGLFSQDPFFPEDVDGPCEFNVERIGGENRIETAALLAQRFITADTVVVATSERFPDALASAPLAAQESGPLLLAKPDLLPQATRGELQRLMPTTVYVMGDENAISSSVVDAIQAEVPGATITRIGGSDRYETAAMVAGMISQDSTPEAFLASGENFPDALVLSALASRSNAPLLLTKATHLPSSTAASLASFDYDTLQAAGGEGVLSEDVLDEAAAIGGATSTRYAGDDRYETSALVLAQFPAEGDVYVATGERFPDALTSVPVAGRTQAGIALSRLDAVPAPVMTEIERLIAGDSFPQITVVGDELSLSASVMAQLQALFETSEAPTSGPLTDRNIPQGD